MGQFKRVKQKTGYVDRQNFVETKLFLTSIQLLSRVSLNYITVLCKRFRIWGFMGKSLSPKSVWDR